MKRQGRKFKGPRAVRRLSPSTRPTTTRGGGINPRVAGRDTAMRVRSLEAVRAFHDAYREAWTKMKQGPDDFWFPAGTWRLRVHYAVRCHPFPA